MDIIENLVNFFKSPPEETKGKTPEGMCPACWGYQKYDGIIRDLYKDKQIDVNNHEESYAFIQKFMKERIDGKELKGGEVHFELRDEAHKAHQEK